MKLSVQKLKFFWLLINIGITFVLLTAEIVGGRLAAEVTVDALAIYIESAFNIFWVDIFFICHVRKLGDVVSACFAQEHAKIKPEFTCLMITRPNPNSEAS